MRSHAQDRGAKALRGLIELTPTTFLAPCLLWAVNIVQAGCALVDVR
jgi:hypothetical protein